MSLLLTNVGGVSSGGGLDPVTSAWIAQVVSRGGTVSGGRQTLVNNLVTSLKSASVFTLFDRILLMASENIQQATTDLVNPAATQATNTATFTTDRGVAGDGTTTFFDTKWDPSTGTNYTLNSASILNYDASTTFGAGAGRLGVTDGTNETELRFTSTTGLSCALNGASSGSGQTVSNVKSIFISTRTSSTSTQYYQNGTAAGGANTDAVGTARPTGFTYWASGGQNLFNNFAFGMTDTFGLFAAMGAVNSTQAGSINTAFQTYLTAIGA